MNHALSRIALFSLLPIASSFAGHPVVTDKTVVETSPFEKGRMEVQVGASYYFSIGHSGSQPNVDDLGGLIRGGWMLSDIHGDGLLRGNWELLLEGSASGITKGPGSVLASGALLLRYNFVQPDTKWVPYFQLGGGGTYSDMHEDLSQRLLGREWSFNLQGGLGTRYLWSDRCALFLECNFRHISNADTADRNVGLNSLGGVVGVSMFF